MNDLEALTKPVTVKIRENLLPDTDTLEFVCNEGERDAANIAEMQANVKKTAEEKETPKKTPPTDDGVSRPNYQRFDSGAAIRNEIPSTL